MVSSPWPSGPIPEARNCRASDAPFCLIDPALQQARGCDVVLFIAQVMNFAHFGKHCPVVFAQLKDHIERIGILRVVIAEAQRLANVSDGLNGDESFAKTACGRVLGLSSD